MLLIETYTAKDGFKADIYQTTCYDVFDREFIGLKAVRCGDDPNTVGSGLFGYDGFRNITLDEMKRKLEL